MELKSVCWDIIDRTREWSRGLAVSSNNDFAFTSWGVQTLSVLHTFQSSEFKYNKPLYLEKAKNWTSEHAIQKNKVRFVLFRSVVLFNCLAKPELNILSLHTWVTGGSHRYFILPSCVWRGVWRRKKRLQLRIKTRKLHRREKHLLHRRI